MVIIYFTIQLGKLLYCGTGKPNASCNIYISK